MEAHFLSQNKILVTVGIDANIQQPDISISKKLTQPIYKYTNVSPLDCEGSTNSSYKSIIILIMIIVTCPEAVLIFFIFERTFLR